MSRLRLASLTPITMMAFSANSLLCRAALAAGHIDASSFTLVRIVAGALVLSMLLLIQFHRYTLGGSWLTAAALFGAVQTTMIGYGL